jgi:hypothetical protein
MMQRQAFHFADTGTEGDSGPPIFGTIRHVRWILESGDTGGSLQIGLHPALASDTGLGFLVINEGLQPQMTRVPIHFDTGTGLSTAIIGVGDRLRVKRIASALGAIVGRVYVWIE